MSIILDALKKSENDRQRQSGPALFEVKVAPPRTGLPLWAIAIVVLLGVNLVIVAWMVFRHPSQTASASTGPGAVAVPASATPAPGASFAPAIVPPNSAGQGPYANAYPQGYPPNNGGQPSFGQGQGGGAWNPNGGGNPQGGNWSSPGAAPNSAGGNWNGQNGGSNSPGGNWNAGSNGSNSPSGNWNGPGGGASSSGGWNQQPANWNQQGGAGQPGSALGQQNGAPGMQRQGGAQQSGNNSNTDGADAQGGNPDDYAPATDAGPAAAMNGRVKRGTDVGLPLYQDAASAPGAGLPQLRLDLHVFAARPQDRFVMINMRKLREGDSLPDGVRIDSITPEGAVVSRNGSRYLLPRE